MGTKNDCFYVSVNEMSDFIQSPLNYTGGKYRLLPQILPLFPSGIDTFVDLFCGGGNVGCNVRCNHVIFNDINRNVVRLLEMFRDMEKDNILDTIDSLIEKYELSRVSKNGYKYYSCESETGVGAYNKSKFLQLREDFNREKPPYGNKYYAMLYVLIVYSFNNQIRFNSKGEYNLPVGKRDFNYKMENKLSMFMDRIKSISCSFAYKDFRHLNVAMLGDEDFVYCDPPYLITCATYNEQGLWGENEERALLNKLDELNNANIKFALSNVLRSKGKENGILLDWIKSNPRFRCINLDYNYANSNYQVKDKLSKSEEVLIINY